MKCHVVSIFNIQRSTWKCVRFVLLCLFYQHSFSSFFIRFQIIFFVYCTVLFFFFFHFSMNRFFLQFFPCFKMLNTNVEWWMGECLLLNVKYWKRMLKKDRKRIEKKIECWNRTCMFNAENECYTKTNECWIMSVKYLTNLTSVWNESFNHKR